MKTMLIAALLAVTAAGASVHAQAVATPADAAAPGASADRGERKGFAGQLLITPDADWRERWNTPGSSQPELSRADAVAIGGQLHILVFLANPAPGLGNRADVRCDIKVIRPDGTFSVSRRDLVCYEGVTVDDAGHRHLAAPTMTFNAEPTDLRGTWRVQVTLLDRNRGVELPLESVFTVTD